MKFLTSTSEFSEVGATSQFYQFVHQNFFKQFLMCVFESANEPLSEISTAYEPTLNTSSQRMSHLGVSKVYELTSKASSQQMNYF